MMITVAELEELIVRTPAGEQVVFEKREIGSTDSVAEKLNQLKLSRSGDPHYVIFVGINKFGECLLILYNFLVALTVDWLAEEQGRVRSITGRIGDYC